jgi:hypothetical protein
MLTIRRQPEGRIGILANCQLKPKFCYHHAFLNHDNFTVFIYVEHGEGFIEAHHRMLVSQLDGKTLTKLEDLALVECSTDQDNFR